MLSGTSRDIFPGLGAIFQFDSRDSLTTATRGWWNSVDAIWHGGSGAYVTFDLDVRRYQPLTPRQTLLATTLVTLQSGEPGVDVPTYTDYAIGGEKPCPRLGLCGPARQEPGHCLARVPLHDHSDTWLSARRLQFLCGPRDQFGDVGSAWSVPDDFTRNAISGGGVGLRLFLPALKSSGSTSRSAAAFKRSSGSTKRRSPSAAASVDSRGSALAESA